MYSPYTIIGGGIAGLTTAIALNRKGIYPLICEAAPVIQEVGAGLALATNAMRALKVTGIAEKVASQGRFLEAFSIFTAGGKLLSRTNASALGKEYGEDNFMIHRAVLHQVLLAEIDPAYIRTNKRLTRIGRAGDRLVLTFADDTVLETDQLIAADGIHSAVRQHLLPGSFPRYAGYTCWRAVINNPLPVVEGATEYWGSQGRFGYGLLKGDQLYWFACINAPQNSAEMKRKSAADLLQRFRDYPDMVKKVLQASAGASLLWNDIHDLRPLPHYAFNNIVLIGDAAHATTPNMGQGACMAIEDAVILATELERSSDPKTAFRNFEARRLKRTHTIMRNSKMLGRMAHLENKLLVTLRNGFFKVMPASIQRRQLRMLYDVNLD